MDGFRRRFRYFPRRWFVLAAALHARLTILRIRPTSRASRRRCCWDRLTIPFSANMNRLGCPNLRPTALMTYCAGTESGSLLML